MSRLDRLLRPRSIAVFGGKWAGNVVEQCQRMEFDGQIWPVHPSRDRICGLRCFRSVSELPGAPDASFIGVNRKAAIQVIDQLSEAGAGGAVCFASGFAEAGREDSKGADFQHRLVDAAADMPFLGPNCYGYVNYLDGTALWPDQHGGTRCSTGVGIVTQSSNIAINLTMQRRGLPIGCVMTAGNQAQLSQANIASELIDDPRITAIGLYIEGFGEIADYARLAEKARRLNKPIVAIKAGRSHKSRKAMVSHTASIIGSDQAADAVFRRLGIGRVRNVQEFLETLKLLHGGGPLGGRRLGSMSCSGGEAGLVADASVGRRVKFDDPLGEQEAALRKALGPLVHISNPLDYHTWHWGDEQALTDIFRAMLLGSYDLALLVMDFPRTDRCSDLAWKPAVGAISRAAASTGSRVAVVSSMPEGLPEIWAEKLLDAGIVPLQGIDEAITAAEAAADIGECWSSKIRPPLTCPPRAGDAGRLLDEAEAKQLLKEAGVQVPGGAVARDEAEATAIADEVGYPVVLKRLGVAHKTEENAIALGLTCRDHLLASMNGMDASTGFLVERQIGGAVAELIVGVLRDPECGLLLTIGTGGTWAEHAGDHRHLLLPVTRSEIQDALGELGAWPVLEGCRNTPGADIGAVAGAIHCVARLARQEAGTLIELEINPLLALRQGAVAVDALIRKSSEGA